MSPWAKRLLVASMLGWTLLTTAAGWYAFRGGGTRAAAGLDATLGTAPGTAADSTTAGTAAAQTDPSAGSLTGTLDETTQTGAGSDLAAAAPYSMTRPPPTHAGDAGASLTARSLNVDGPRPRPDGARTNGVVVLDPGHGRGDPGATHYLPDGTWDITEADSNRRNAELIRDELVRMGYEVYLTREGEGQGPGRPLPLQWITSDLYARVGLAKAVDADVYLAIHGNGASVRSISGPETWYCGQRGEAAANERLATMVQQAMIDALREYGYNPPDRGIREDAAAHHSAGFCQFVVTRESPVPAALLEFLFLSNDDDARVLVDNRAHVIMARYVAAALDAFMEERAAAANEAAPSPTATPGEAGAAGQ